MRNIYTFLMLISVSLFAQAQLPDCTKSEFYAVGNAGDEWGRVTMKFNLESPTGPVSYNGSTQAVVDMAPDGPFIPNSAQFPNPMGLAISDFGEGPQFYASTMSFANDIFQVAKYDGTNWDVVIPEIFSHQIGGRGQHLYLQTHPIAGHVETDIIYHFDGEEVVMIRESQGDDDRIIAADIAVDENGNAYIFTGNVVESPGVADTLHIINPEGETLAEYPVNLSVMGSSGAFFMYDTLYLFFGPYNYLVPVQVIDNQVIVGNQIPVPKVFIETVFGPNGTFDVFFMALDADACYTDNLSANEVFMLRKSMVYPNPVKDKLFFESDGLIDRIEVFNMAGSSMFTKELRKHSGEIDVRFLPAGTYLLSIISGGKIMETHKFIKQ